MTEAAKLSLRFRKYIPDDPSTHPQDGDEIIFLQDSDFYASVEIKFGRVDWQWNIVDDEGRDTGSSILYDKKYPQPANTVLVISVDQCCFGDSVRLWCPSQELDTLLDKANEDCD